MKTKEIFQYILGAIIVAGFFGVLITLVVKGGYDSVLQLVVGALIGAFVTVVGYFYGSSKGSADKTEALNKRLDNSNNV